MLPGPHSSAEERKLGFFEQCAAVCIALVSLLAAFQLMLQLRDILEPLIFSGFVVAAIEKPVEHVYQTLTSCDRIFPCLRRQQRSGNAGVQVEEGERRPLQASEQRSTSGQPAHEPVSPARNRSALLMVEETVQCHGLLRIVAVLVVLSAISLALFGLGVIIWYNCMQMKEEWPVYKAGALRVAGSFEKFVDSVLKNLHVPQSNIDSYAKKSYEKLLSATEHLIFAVLNGFLENASQALSWLLLTFLYVFFWLLRPLPLTDHMNEFIRSYILKKTIICIGYGICVGVLFFILHIDLAAVFGLASFMLSYLPEVGPILSMALPIPVILLDGRLTNPLATLCAALLGQLLLKFIFSNYLEVKLIEDDRMMMIHPVWILLGLTYFGFVWGPVGMLLSVPILAMFKALVIPDTGVVPKPYGLPVLACLEGRLYRKGEMG
jgi:predicted PurR-regulated permease PerM